jgi:N-formylglutamate amidohydrolase
MNASSGVGMNVERLVPFRRIGPARASSPVVIAVPHAGRVYPAALAATQAVPLSVLERLEDRYADRLIRAALARGAVGIVAEIARAWIDLNRAPDEVEPPESSDAVASSRRARIGLGLVPSRLGGRKLFQRRPTPEEVAARLASVHQPYHQAVGDALTEAVAIHGRALLIDCHSMPPLGGPNPAQVVVGDLHGRSAATAITQAVVETARAAGYRVALNQPYAGAYTLMRHGRTAQVDAVQVELDRAAYLSPDLRQPGAGLDRAADLIADLCDAAAAAQRPQAIAAE